MQRALGLILLSAVVGLTLPVVGQEPGKAVSKERLNERDRAWSQARELRTKGDFAGAIAAGELTLDIERELVGDDHPDHISTVAFLAECEEAREDWEAARSRRTEVLNRAVKAHGEAHYRVVDARLALQHLSRLRSMTAAERASLREATALNAQVLKLFAKGEYRAAEDPALTALKVREKLLGSDHPDTAHSVNNLAFSYQGQGNYSAAEPLYQRALTIYEKALGPHHPFTARSLNNLAEFYKSQANYVAAETCYKRALTIYENALGGSHPDTARVLNNLAVMYKSRGNYAAAEPLYERALKICEKALGPDHPHTAASVNNLAVFYETQGNHTAAEPLYQRALQICERVLGPDHPDTASSLNNLGLLHKTQGKYSVAEPFYQRALEIREKAQGPDHPDTAQSVHNLATLYNAKGDYAAAEPLYKRAFKIREKARGPNHPDTAESLNSLAGLYASQGNYAAAELHYRRALKIYEKALGPDHPSVATCLTNLSEISDSHGDEAAAEQLCERALKIRETALGPDHPSTAHSLHNLAASYKAQGRYTAAEPLYLRALKIREKAFGPDDLGVASILHNLAHLYDAQENYAAAEPLAQRALEIRENTLGTDHPDTALSLNTLAGLYYSQGNDAVAEPLFRRAWQSSVRHLERTASIQTELQQLAMGQMLTYQFAAFLSCLTRLPDRDRLAFGTVLSWKGTTLLRQRSMRLTADQPEIAPLFQELQAVTRQWANLATASPPANEKAAQAFRIRCTDSQREKERLEVELSKRSAVYRQGTQGVSVEELQKSLPPQSVLVDFLEYRHFDLTSGIKWERRLLAFTLSAEGEVRWQQLGPVAPLIESIDIWRKSFGTSPESQRAGQQLRAALWEPLLGDIENADLVLISPDGVLGRLPFAALPGREPGRYLLEDHRIAMVPVPQLIPVLTRNEEPRPRQHELLLFGDVDYDASASDENPPSASERRPRLFASRQSAQHVTGGAKWSRLAATGTEVTAIKILFNRHFSSDADKLVELRGAQATESAFRKLAPESRLLHLATHGYFAAPDKKSALQDESLAQNRGLRGEMFGERLAAVRGYSPGLLSGLVFAGANRPPPATSEGMAGRTDDGYMTSDEIAFLPLDGVDFVALSACETGLGQVAGGEGLLGLQRAFQIAGAKTVVASLWKVPDQATSILMQRYYENLWEKKMGRLDAFREAQISMFRDQGELRTTLLSDQQSRGLKPVGGAKEDSSISPFYWAAFVLSGDWR